MAKINVPATIAKLKALGYTVYVWKEGEEEIPGPLYDRIKVEANHIAKELEDKKVSPSLQNVGNVFGSMGHMYNTPYLLETASSMISKIRSLPPVDQNRVIALVIELLSSERDRDIQRLQEYRKECSSKMQDITKDLEELVNASDHLTEITTK